MPPSNFWPPRLPTPGGAGSPRGQAVPPGVVHSRRSALLLVLGYLAAQALLPWKALALIPLGWAAVESGRARVAFSRRGAATGTAGTSGPSGSGGSAWPQRERSTPRGSGGVPGQRSAVMWTVFGMVLIGLLLTSVIVPFLFYGSMKSYQDCMLGANTGAAAADCQKVLRGSIEPLLGRASG